jgi:hypothetical protein
MNGLVPVLVHPDQSARLAVEMRHHGIARGALRKMLQEWRVMFMCLKRRPGWSSDFTV